MKFLIRVARQYRKLMNRVFVFVLSMSINPIQRQDNIVTVNTACAGAGVKNRDVCQGADSHKTLYPSLAEECLQLAAKEFVK